MSLPVAQIVSELAALLGPHAVIGEPERMGRYLKEPRKRFRTGAAAVTTPGSVAQVQAILRWANERGVGIIAQGGNTGLVGAQVR